MRWPFVRRSLLKAALDVAIERQKTIEELQDKIAALSLAAREPVKAARVIEAAKFSTVHAENNKAHTLKFRAVKEQVRAFRHEIAWITNTLGDIVDGKSNVPLDDDRLKQIAGLVDRYTALVRDIDGGIWQ